MRKTFLLWSIITAALFAVGCGQDSGTDGKQPTPTPPTPVTPEISIKEVDVTTNSFTFEIATNVAGEFGYCYVKDGFNAPAFHEWFTMNSGEVEDKTIVTIEDLNDNTTYNLYIVLRSNEDGTYSDPKNLTFTTLDDGVDNPITIDNVTYDRVTFTINIPGDYLFQCIDKDYLEYVGQTPETYISTLGIGITSSGVQTYEWFDGGSYGDYAMRIREDSEYYVIAAISDGKHNVIGDIFVKEFKTPKKPHSDAGLKTELKEIGATSVIISTTPDASVSQYYVYVRDKAWAESTIGEYGESMLATLIKYPSAGSWILNTANEATWSGLIPETEYYCMTLIVDNMGAEALQITEFTTLSKTLPEPTADVNITAASKDPHKTLSLNIFSEDAAIIRVAFNTAADIQEQRNMGKSDNDIVRSYGYDLSGSEVEAAKTTGISLINEELWPNTEYIAIVSIKNIEHTEIIKVASFTTPKKALPARVESDLFESLLGEWEVSYELYQVNGLAVSISDYKVTIAAGADDKSAKEYRDYNRLVILGWPFNVSSSGKLIDAPYYSPAKLMDSSSYWRNYESLAYRDYGPKLFIEIGEGNTISIPSERNHYLYNWGDDGYILYFYGADYNNKMSAPVTFPVTLSDDGNTLSIGACHSGAEFDYGVYRPSVFRDYEMWAVAISDIVLKRVQ